MNKQNKYFYDWGTRYANDDSDSGSSTVTSSSSDTSRDEAPQQPYLMVAQRSKRQRAQIQYNFDEFDEMIKKAVLSDDARTEYKREDALQSHRGRARLYIICNPFLFCSVSTQPRQGYLEHRGGVRAREARAARTGAPPAARRANQRRRGRAAASCCSRRSSSC